MDEFMLNDFLSSFNDQCYPEAFLHKYELMECLANNPMGETLLVKDRFGTYFVAKCYTDSSLMSKTTENVLLKRLHHDGLPEFVEEFQNDAMLCVVRQYASGTPLNRLEKPLTQRQIIAVGMQLCDILSYLHGQTPPVIHRDIKPQNIVLSESGKVMLIDFGISRVYDMSARADTVFFGTQEFAPPEQYGFSQTDSRADIFSLGVVLGWLLTGTTQFQSTRIANPRLARIVKKCTAFAPKDRYRDAQSVKRALLAADGHRLRTALRIACGTAALFAALTAGFAVGRFTDVRPALFYNNNAAYFKEPLIEQAVRLQLGKTPAETILTEELDQVTELYLYYDQTVKTWEDWNTLRGNVDNGILAVGTETISTLDDVAKLKNLKRLCLGRQNISDITAISGLTDLDLLEFCSCPVEDIRVIGGFTHLKHLSLNDCVEITDLSPLANCTKISELTMCSCQADDFSVLAKLGDFDYLHMQNVDPEKFLPYLEGKTVTQLNLGFRPLVVTDLGVINGLRELSFDRMQITSLSGIDCLQNLTSIRFNGMPGIDLSPLTTMPYLQTVTLSEDMREAAGAIQTNAKFDIVYSS